MNWLLLAIIIFLLIIFIVIFTKIRVFLNYYHGNDNDDLKIEFRVFFGLIKYKVHVPLIKVDDNSPSIIVKSKKGTSDGSNQKSTQKVTPEIVLDSFYNTKILLKHVIGLHKIIRNFLKKVQVKNFIWDTEIGIGDAAGTGMLTGSFWTIKGSLIGLISSNMRLMEMPQLSVTPNFQSSVIITNIQCMFQFRIGQAIFAAIKLFKFWKGGRPKFRPITQPLTENKSNSV